MRLIATLQDEEQASLLSNYLTSQGIDNIPETSPGQDWGDEHYGEPTYTIWVIEESSLAKASEIVRQFNEDRQNPRFRIPSLLTPRPNEEESDPAESNSPSDSRQEIEPLGKVTFYLLLICSLLYFFGETTAPAPTAAETKTFVSMSLPLIPLYYPPLKKQSIFDYPHAFDIVDELIAKIDADKVQETTTLPAELDPLVKKYRQTPYWTGFYDKIVTKIKNPQASWNFDAPLFEKVRQGEVWRLITPALLHADIFHLLFNMVWLAILGKQIEYRIGTGRYLFFVIIAALITNTSQYLMTGVNFLGFSGIVCTMIMFVWVRQRKTPWEGYLLQKSTLNFAMIFLLSILLLQLASFYTEIAHDQPIAPQIANTAHMTGLLLGYLLGSLDFFSLKTQ